MNSGSEEHRREFEAGTFGLGGGFSFEWTTALRLLKARKSRSLSLVTWLSVLGVATGVAALVGGFSVTTGFEIAFQEKLLGMTSHVKVRHAGLGIIQPDGVKAQIEDIDGVVAASVSTQNDAMITGPSASTGIAVKGIRPSETAQVLTLADNVISGRLVDLEDTGSAGPPSVFLGSELARSIGAEVGDSVSLLAARSSLQEKRWGESQSAPKQQAYTVVGLFQSGYYEFDSRVAYVHLTDAQDFFELGSRVDSIEVRVQDPENASAVADRIRDAIYLPRQSVYDWKMAFENLFVSLSMQRFAILVVLGVMVVLASCNVASMLIMMVMERTRDIAILKAMGLSNRGVRKIFLYQGLMVGAMGTALGIALAYILFEWIMTDALTLDPKVYGIDQLPIAFDPLDYAMAGVGAMLITLVASLIPAIRASRLHPVQGVRDIG